MNDGKEGGHEEECGDGCQQQAADDGAAERRVLFAAVAQAEGHGHHADDHGEGGHEHGAEADKAGVQRGLRASPTRISNCSRAKLTTRMELAVATPMHMMAPVRAGTLRRVPVRKRNQTMPASAAGRAADDEERIEPGLEVDHDEQVDEQDGESQAGEQADVGLVHGFALAAKDEVRAAGQIFLVAS